MAASKDKCQILPLDVVVKLGLGLQITFSKCIEELIYNSIDANSGVIEIKIEKSSIVITDNGTGICEDDLRVIGTRFTTSKCHTLAELNSLTQYGYRGESLWGIITNYRKVEIRTCIGNKILCRKIRYDDPSILITHQNSTNNEGFTGTEITISGIMDMSSCSMEYIKTMLHKICLINPHVNIILRDEKSETIHKSTATESIITLFYQFICKYQDESIPTYNNKPHLIEVKHSESIFKIEGFVCIDIAESKNLQFLYVNKRFVGANSKIMKIMSHHLSKALGLRTTTTTNATNSQPLFSSQVSSTAGGSSKKKYPIFLISIICPLFEYDFIGDEVKFRNLELLTKVVEEFAKKFQLKREQIPDPTNLITIAESASIIPSKRAAVTSHEEEPPSKQQYHHSNIFYQQQQQQPSSNFSNSNHGQVNSCSNSFKFPNIWRQQQQQQSTMDNLPIPAHKIHLPPPLPPKQKVEKYLEDQLLLPLKPFSSLHPSKNIQQDNNKSLSKDALSTKLSHEIPLQLDDNDISRKRDREFDEPMEEGSSQDSKRIKITTEKPCNILDGIPSISKSSHHPNIVEDDDDDDDASIISNSLKGVAISSQNNSKAAGDPNTIKKPMVNYNIFSPTRPSNSPFQRWPKSLPTSSSNIMKLPFQISQISPIPKSGPTLTNHSPVSNSTKTPFWTSFKMGKKASCNTEVEGEKIIQHNNNDNNTTPTSTSFDGNKVVQLFSGQDLDNDDNNEVLNLSLEVGQELVKLHPLPETRYYPLMFTAVLTSPPQVLPNSKNNKVKSSVDNISNENGVKVLENTRNNVFFTKMNVTDNGEQSFVSNRENPSKNTTLINEDTTTSSNGQIFKRNQAKSEPLPTTNYKSILSFGSRLSKLNQYIKRNSKNIENSKEETSHMHNDNDMLVDNDSNQEEEINGQHNDETELMSQQSIPQENDMVVNAILPLVSGDLKVSTTAVQYWNPEKCSTFSNYPLIVENSNDTKQDRSHELATTIRAENPLQFPEINESLTQNQETTQASSSKSTMCQMETTVTNLTLPVDSVGWCQGGLDSGRKTFCRFSKGDLLRMTVNGNVGNKYISTNIPLDSSSCSSTNGRLLVLFDQHAVDEYVKLESALENLYDKTDDGDLLIASSTLAEPLSIQLEGEEMEMVKQHEMEIQAIGIHYEIQPQNVIQILKAPKFVVDVVHIQEFEADPKMIMRKLLMDLIREHLQIVQKNPRATLYESQIAFDVLKSLSCKEAVQLGESLSKEKCDQLMDKYIMYYTPGHCLHLRNPLFIKSLD